MLAHSKPKTATPYSPMAVPRFVVADQGLSSRWGGQTFVVVSGGRAGHLDLETGDVIVTTPDSQEGDLVMLVPGGRGRPMLGRHTRKGLVSEPSGVSCSPERWRVAGRIGIHVRPEPQGRRRLLPFPDRAEAQQSLPLAPRRPAVGAPALALILDGEPSDAARDLLSQRVAGLEFRDRRLASGLGGSLVADAPMDAAESLSTELWQRFRLSMRVAVAPTPELALALAERLDASGIAVLGADASVELLLEAPERSTPQRRQLGLWR